MKKLIIALLLGAALPAQAQTYLQTNIVPTLCPLQAVATGGTAVAALPAQLAQHGFIIANMDTTEPLWVNFIGATAVANTAGNMPLGALTSTTFAGPTNSIFISPPGMALGSPGPPPPPPYPPLISAVAATSGHKFFCVYW